MAEAGTPSARVDQAKRLERALVRVRWFALALGLYLVSQTNTGPPPHASTLVVALSFVTIALVAVGNVVIHTLVGRLLSEAAIRRVGILAIIALVAGFMARSLAREAQRSAESAGRFEELAKREMAARMELAAFNTAVLTGVAAEDLDASMQLMASAIAPDLGFQTLTIM